jgi:hypothetical protein
VPSGSWGIGYELVDVLDFDGSGIAEILVELTGYEGRLRSSSTRSAMENSSRSLPERGSDAEKRSE